MPTVTPPFSAQEVANYFIELANNQVIDEDGTSEGITNLKLQKILYFAQAAFVSINDDALFADKIEAWKYGPVIKVIYDEFKVNGNQPIENGGSVPEMEESTMNFLNSIWEIYGKFSAAELVEITHSHKPWKQAFFEGKDGGEITVDALKAYYKGYFLPSDKDVEPVAV